MGVLIIGKGLLRIRSTSVFERGEGRLINEVRFSCVEYKPGAQPEGRGAKHLDYREAGRLMRRGYIWGVLGVPRGSMGFAKRGDKTPKYFEVAGLDTP